MINRWIYIAPMFNSLHLLILVQLAPCVLGEMIPLYRSAPTRMHLSRASFGPRLTVDTCVGPTTGCIKSYGGNSTRFKMHSVWIMMPSAYFFQFGVRARQYSAGTYADAPPPMFLTAYNQPSNRAPPCLVQGLMIHLCGLLLKWVPVTRVS